MNAEAPPQAPRPDRPPGRHRLPEPWERKPDPFAVKGDHRPPGGTALPEESRGSDRWAAVKSAVIFLAGAALLTWIIVTVAMG